MNKLLAILSFALWFMSCSTKRQATTVNKASETDTVPFVTADLDLGQPSTANDFDTTGIYKSPVKVLAARFAGKEYSNYKEVYLKYKNVSGKKIEAIRFKWYGQNAFGEPADMGVYKGWGTGFSGDALRPGATDDGTWDALSSDGKKIIIAYPYEVAFSDGTKWALKNK